MNDIVAALRRDADATTSGPSAILWREAADEIERLRKAFETIQLARLNGLFDASIELQVNGELTATFAELDAALKSPRRLLGSCVERKINVNDPNELISLFIFERRSAKIAHVWLGDELLITEADGWVRQGRYANLIKINRHDGGEGQKADPDLVAALPGWTDNYRMTGIAYIAMFTKHDPATLAALRQPVWGELE